MAGQLPAIPGSGCGSVKSFKLQPTFSLDVPIDADEMITRLRAAIRSAELQGKAVSAGRCVDFQIEPGQQRFWSPHLSVQVYEADDLQGSQLYCRFSPRPEVWTMCMFLYFLAAFGIAASCVYGYVQWILHQSPWAFLLAPVGLGIVVALHLASLIGQGLSNDQMTLLRKRFDRAVEIALDRCDLTATRGT